MPFIQEHGEVSIMTIKDRLLQYVFECLLKIQDILMKLGE